MGGTGEIKETPFGPKLILKPAPSSSFSSMRSVLQISTERNSDGSEDCRDRLSLQRLELKMCWRCRLELPLLLLGGDAGGGGGTGTGGGSEKGGEDCSSACFAGHLLLPSSPSRHPSSSSSSFRLTPRDAIRSADISHLAIVELAIGGTEIRCINAAAISRLWRRTKEDENLKKYIINTSVQSANVAADCGFDCDCDCCCCVCCCCRCPFALL